MSEFDPTKPLKPRHERFAQLLAAGGAQRESYLKAGYRPGKSAHQNASRLANRIKARIQFLVGQQTRREAEPAKQVAAAAERDRAWLLAELLKNYEREKTEHPRLAHQILGSYARFAGLLPNRHDDTRTMQQELEAMTPAERREDALKLHELLLPLLQLEHQPAEAEVEQGRPPEAKADESDQN